MSVFADECPLCGQPHTVRLHTLVDRTYKTTENKEHRSVRCTVTIEVPRLFCAINYQLRKHTGEPLQYTITILPGFLVPYSTIPCDVIHHAVDAYLSTDSKINSYTDAALEMECEHPLSFALYLYRVQQRLSVWISFLLQLLIVLGAEIQNLDSYTSSPMRFSAQWSSLKLLATTYFLNRDKIPHFTHIPQPFQWQFLYASFSRHHMGLGP